MLLNDNRTESDQNLRPLSYRVTRFTIQELSISSWAPLSRGQALSVASVQAEPDRTRHAPWPVHDAAASADADARRVHGRNRRESALGGAARLRRGLCRR